jgi:hypothetical protein
VTGPAEQVPLAAHVGSPPPLAVAVFDSVVPLAAADAVTGIVIVRLPPLAAGTPAGTLHVTVIGSAPLVLQ